MQPYNQVLNMWSFWIMTSAMSFMTFTLTFAGVVQIHLQRVLGQTLHGGAGPARAVLLDAARRRRLSSLVSALMFVWAVLGAGAGGRQPAGRATANAGRPASSRRPPCHRRMT